MQKTKAFCQQVFFKHTFVFQLTKGAGALVWPRVEDPEVTDLAGTDSAQEPRQSLGILHAANEWLCCVQHHMCGS